MRQVQAREQQRKLHPVAQAGGPVASSLRNYHLGERPTTKAKGSRPVAGSGSEPDESAEAAGIRGKRLKTCTKHRSAEQNELAVRLIFDTHRKWLHAESKTQAHLRYHVAHMMGRKNSKSPITPGPETSELNAFEAYGHGGPTREDFRLHLDGSRKTCRWNKRAGEIFVEDYLTHNAALGRTRLLFLSKDPRYATCFSSIPTLSNHSASVASNVLFRKPCLTVCSQRPFIVNDHSLSMIRQGSLVHPS